MYESTKIKERIKKECKRKKISQKEMLIKASINDHSMKNWTKSIPKADTLAKIADALECSVDYLLGRSESPEIAVKAPPNEITRPKSKRPENASKAPQEVNTLLETATRI